MTEVDKDSIIGAARDRVAKHDIHRIDTARLLADVEGILMERSRQPGAEPSRFSEEMTQRFPYLSSNAPLLFKEAVQSVSPEETLRNTRTITGVIDSARTLGQGPTECAIRVNAAFARQKSAVSE